MQSGTPQIVLLVLWSSPSIASFLDLGINTFPISVTGYTAGSVTHRLTPRATLPYPSPNGFARNAMVSC